MNFRFPMTNMIAETPRAKVPRPFRVLLTFLLVMLIADFAEGFAGTILVLPALLLNGDFRAMLTDESVLESLTTGDGSLFTERFTAIVSSLPAWLTVALSFTPVVLGLAAIVYCRGFEHRSLASMGLRKNDAAKDSLIGLLLGIVIGALAVGSAFLTGSVTDLMPNQNADAVLVIFQILSSVACAFAYELLIHGYLMTTVARNFGPTMALVISSVMFAGLYEYDLASFLSFFFLGLFLGMLVLKRGNIWASSLALAAFRAVIAQVSSLGAADIGADPSRLYSVTLPDSVTTFPFTDGYAFVIVAVIAVAAVFPLPTKPSEIAVLIKEDEEKEGE